MALVGELCDEKAPKIDWHGLRSLSLRPGGFGPSRAHIWPEILGVSKITEDVTTEALTSDEHRDERQIRLDTDRSFVLYPVGENALSAVVSQFLKLVSFVPESDAPMNDKEVMQEKLNGLLVSIFRKHPKLNYFQGYHDIVSVLFLTLPEEMQLVCAEKISLHRVRDSMGLTLEPVLGLLRVTKNLLRLADLEYAGQLERSSQLPFYALSNLLTLFSHDMPTLPLIQHVFDYILCRPPIIVVYLATAIILSRKDAIRKLEDEDNDDDMGMSHSLLSSLPPITDEEEPSETIAKIEANINTSGPGEKACKEETIIEISTNTLAKAEPPVEANTLIYKEIDHHVPSADDTTEPMNLPTRESTTEKAAPSSSCTSRPPSPPPPSRSHHQTQVSLSTLLTRADELYTLYPPIHPDLSLSSIMGPQSVVYTWNESFSSLPTDVEAEAMVSQPGLIVYPYIEEDEVVEDTDNAESEAEWEEKLEPGPSKRKRFRRKLKGKVKNKLKRFRRVRVDQTTGMVAGAVIVLGIAVAVYGMKVNDRHGGSAMGSMLDSHGRDWRKVAGWFGGAVAGVTERVVSGLSSSTPSGG